MQSASPYAHHESSAGENCCSISNEICGVVFKIEIERRGKESPRKSLEGLIRRPEVRKNEAVCNASPALLHAGLTLIRITKIFKKQGDKETFTDLTTQSKREIFNNAIANDSKCYRLGLR